MCGWGTCLHQHEVLGTALNDQKNLYFSQKVSALVIFHLNFSTYLFLAGPPFAFRVTLIPHHIGLPKCCKHSYRNIYIYTIRFVYLNSIKNKDKNEFKWGQRTFWTAQLCSPVRASIYSIITFPQPNKLRIFYQEICYPGSLSMRCWNIFKKDSYRHHRSCRYVLILCSM